MTNKSVAEQPDLNNLKQKLIDIIKEGTAENLICFMRQKDVTEKIISMPLTQNGMTVVHVAFIYNKALLPVLLRFGADINAPLKEGSTLLHMAAAMPANFFYKNISLLLKLGADVNRLNADSHTALRILMDKYAFFPASSLELKTAHQVFVHCIRQEKLRNSQELRNKYALRLIKKGADPNTKNKYGQTLLHIIAEDMPALIPKLLKFGADPSIQNKEGRNALDILLSVNFFHSTCEYYAILLLQHGVKSKIKAYVKDPKNILQIVYQHFPSIKNWLITCKIPEKKLDDVDYVFKRVNPFALGQQIKFQTKIHQARNQFINFLIILINHRNIKDDKSLIKLLPWEIILNIIIFLDFSAMNKTWQEGISLANQMFYEFDLIREMLGHPGGVNVYQNDSKDQIKFSFYKSVSLFAHLDFPELKKKYTRKDELSKKTAQFRREYALSIWQSHTAHLNYAKKLMLFNSVKKTDLYNEKGIHDFLKKELDEGPLKPRH